MRQGGHRGGCPGGVTLTVRWRRGGTGSTCISGRHKTRRSLFPPTALAAPGRQNKAILPFQWPLGRRGALTDTRSPGQPESGLYPPVAFTLLLSYRGRSWLWERLSPWIKRHSTCKPRRKLQQCEANLPSISGTLVTLESPERFTWFVS